MTTEQTKKETQDKILAEKIKTAAWHLYYENYTREQRCHLSFDDFVAQITYTRLMKRDMSAELSCYQNSPESERLTAFDQYSAELKKLVRIHTIGKKINGSTVVGCTGVIEYILDEKEIKAIYPALRHKVSSLKDILIKTNFDLVKSVLEQYDCPGNSGKALRTAAMKGDIWNIKLLLDNFALDVNSKGRDTEKTALHLAVQYNRADAVKYLVSRGADITALDCYKKTPLDYSNPDMRLLLESKMDVRSSLGCG